MNNYKKEVLFGSLLIIIGLGFFFSGINVNTLNVTNVYMTGIGIIIVVGGLVTFAKTNPRLVDTSSKESEK
jgi:hypothetical protein